MQTIIKNILFIFVISIIGLTSYTMNFLRPYDTLLRVEYTDKRWQGNLFVEGGMTSAKGFNADGARVSPLALFECEQKLLSLFKGFDPCTALGQLDAAIDACDDGIRGHLIPHGSFHMRAAGAFAFYASIKNNLRFSLMMPVMGMELKDVCFVDRTLNVTEDDMRLRAYFSDYLAQNIKKFGDNLSIGSWKRVGPGDMVALFDWSVLYPQYKPLLKSVRLNGRVGLNIPTGLRRDEDKLMAIPFGYDGAVGLLFGGGLDAYMGRHFIIGFDVELLHLFGNTRERRIKTDRRQTELLLLQKACAYKDFGLTQRFNLYVQPYRIYKGLSCLIGYQYFKHGEDRLSLITQEFSSEIANSAKSLDEWTMHQIVINALYNVSYLYNDERAVDYQFCLFARLPCGGQRAILVPTLGVQAALSF